MKKFLSSYLLWMFIISLGITWCCVNYTTLILPRFTNSENAGTFGDSYGALNALFSGLTFAGLIITILIQTKELKNQRVEMSLQREEMQSSRKEFLMNRTTTVIFHQLDRYEEAIKKFHIRYANLFDYSGNHAFNFLSDKIEFRQDNEEEYDFRLKRATFYSEFCISILAFTQSAANSINVVKQLLLQTDLTMEETMDLKNLFFRNLGFTHLNVLEDMYRTMQDLARIGVDKLDKGEKLQTGSFNPDLLSSIVFLENICEFRNVVLTQENFKVTKILWRSQMGARA